MSPYMWLQESDTFVAALDEDGDLYIKSDQQRAYIFGTKNILLLRDALNACFPPTEDEAPQEGAPAGEDHFEEVFCPCEECQARFDNVVAGTHRAGNGQWLCDDCGEAYAVSTPERAADVWYDENKE